MDRIDFTNRPVALDQRPALDDDDFRAVDRRLLVLRSGFVLAQAAVLALASLTIVVLSESFRWLGLVALVLVVGGAAGALIATRLSFRYWGYVVRDHDLTVRKGVVLRSVTSVPFNRVQHASVQSGPIERAMGLATLQVFTAGGSGADLSIAGLAASDAGKLLDVVLTHVAETGASISTPLPPR